MVKTQAPGYYRMMLGDFEITALSDGTADLPMDKVMIGTTPAKVLAALAKAYLKSPVETSVNCYLVNTGTKLVLIDAGAGKLFGPTLGKLLGNLKAAGYKPEQVDEIYITHMHPDHVGGLALDGKSSSPTPRWPSSFDTDSKKATAQRKKAFADAAKQGYFIGVSHLSFPGIGQLRAEGKGYRYYPVNYAGQR